MAFIYAGHQFEFEFLSDDDLITRYIRDGGTFYEIDLLEYLTKMIPKGGTVIDVGAQIGNHAVYFGSQLADRVICVEPNPAVTPILRRNTFHHAGTYTIIEAGLGASEARGSLYQPDTGNCGTMQVQVGSGDVLITTLDAIAPEGVSLVKIDVEGMELDVLRGGTRLLSTQHPDLMIEAATPAIHATHRAFLASYGYAPISCWAVTPTWHFVWKPTLRTYARARTHRLGYRLRRLLSHAFK